MTGSNNGYLPLPPNSQEAEQAVIGSCLIDSTAYDKVRRLIQEDQFYHSKHKLIFQTMEQLTRVGSPVDLLSVSERLKEHGRLNSAGGELYLGEIAESTPFPGNAEYYARIVQEKYLLRNLLTLCQTTTKQLMEDEETNPTQVAEEMINSLIHVRSDTSITARHISSVMPETIDFVKQAAIDDPDTGIPFFSKHLDRMIGRIEQGEVLLVGGRSGSGKSALAGHQALRWAKNGVHVGFASKEMKARQILLRWLSAEILLVEGKTVAYRDLRRGSKETLTQMDVVERAAERLNRLPIFILDDTGYGMMTVGSMRSEFKRLQAQYDEAAWAYIVDYAQIIDSDTIQKNSNREQEVAAISRGVKSMANNLSAPVMLLTQLNEEKKTRESRALFNDATAVLNIEVQRDKSTGKEYDVLRVYKNRFGDLGSVDVNFVREVGLFMSVEEEKILRQMLETQPF